MDHAARSADDLLVYAHGYHAGGTYPLAICNVTNRCNLSCSTCFVYRDENPNVSLGPRREPTDDEMIDLLTVLRERHGIRFMLWMGGEPLLRKDLLTRGVPLFERNTVTTNGTIPLLDLGPDVLYVVSLDGPEAVNDAVRGAGSHAKVIRTLERVPESFSTPVQVQCTVTRRNQDCLEDLVVALRGTRAAWMTFSFYVPGAGERSDLAWPTLEDRMVAVEEVRRLKDAYPGFVRNRGRALDLMAPRNAGAVTANCLPHRLLLPLYLDGDHFTTPFCCYGNDVDCDRCGAWVVFELAALAGGASSPPRTPPRSALSRRRLCRPGGARPDAAGGHPPQARTAHRVSRKELTWPRALVPAPAPAAGAAAAGTSTSSWWAGGSPASPPPTSSRAPGAGSSSWRPPTVSAAANVPATSAASSSRKAPCSSAPTTRC